MSLLNNQWLSACCQPSARKEINANALHALEWLSTHHEELFIRKNGRKISPVYFSSDLPEPGITIGKTILIDSEYMEKAERSQLIWLFSHELQHAQLGFFGNLYKMASDRTAHDRIDHRAREIMLEYIEEETENVSSELPQPTERDL